MKIGEQILIDHLTEAFRNSDLVFTIPEDASTPGMITVDCRLKPNEFIEESSQVNFKPKYADKVKWACQQAGYHTVNFNNTQRTFWVSWKDRNKIDNSKPVNI